MGNTRKKEPIAGERIFPKKRNSLFGRKHLLSREKTSTKFAKINVGLLFILKNMGMSPSMVGKLII